MQVQQKHWIQHLFLSMMPVWKPGHLLCFILFNQAYVSFIHTYVVNVNFINTTKLSKATNIVVCFLCAKAQKEKKMNSAECADTAFVSDYLLDSYKILWNLPDLLFSCNYYSCCTKFYVTPC